MVAFNHRKQAEHRLDRQDLLQQQVAEDCIVLWMWTGQPHLADSSKMLNRTAFSISSRRRRLSKERTQTFFFLRLPRRPSLERVLTRLREHVHNAEEPLVADAHFGARASHQPALGRRRNVEGEVVGAEQRLLELARDNLV